MNNKKPCNPSDPSHTSRCCDRKPRQEAEIPLLKKEMVPADSGTMMVTVLMGNHANIHMCKSIVFKNPVVMGRLCADSSTSKILNMKTVFLGNRFQEKFQERRRGKRKPCKYVESSMSVCTKILIFIVY